MSHYGEYTLFIKKSKLSYDSDSGTYSIDGSKAYIEKFIIDRDEAVEHRRELILNKGRGALDSTSDKILFKNLK